ncbi:MAG TPA: RES domain-containing protein [Solirubrobacteraceae bacterium]|jgi:hypothetical protein|nr:RES domain-containing protein [Solirubrobacteraceae bacterium]
MNRFAVLAPDGPLYRLARAPDPWAWPDWAYAGLDGTFGNRWDDPLGSYRVLYASTRRVGTFIETLARFRPDLAVVAGLEEIEWAWRFALAPARRLEVAPLRVGCCVC